MLFFHNSYGTPEFPDCGNLVGADWMENLRWANTEPSMHFRETNTDPSMHFRQANTDLSMHFRKTNTEIFAPRVTPNFIHNFTSMFTSVFTPTFNPNITTILLHHNEYNVSCLSSNRKLNLLYSLCFVYSFLFCSKVTSLEFPANGTCRKRPSL